MSKYDRVLSKSDEQLIIDELGLYKLLAAVGRKTIQLAEQAVLAKLAEQQKPTGANEALRNALDLIGLDMGAYNSPKEALEALIDWHVDAATNPKANGGFQLVPIEPDPVLLISMACCLNHGFGLLDEVTQHSMLHDMEKLYNEVVGTGYYSKENQDRYLAMLTTTSKKDSN